MQSVNVPQVWNLDKAVIVRANLRLGYKTFVNINNYFEGCAPLTAETFLKILGGQKG